MNECVCLRCVNAPRRAHISRAGQIQTPLSLSFPFLALPAQRAVWCGMHTTCKTNSGTHIYNHRERVSTAAAAAQYPSAVQYWYTVQYRICRRRRKSIRGGGDWSCRCHYLLLSLPMYRTIPYHTVQHRQYPFHAMLDHPLPCRPTCLTGKKRGRGQGEGRHMCESWEGSTVPERTVYSIASWPRGREGERRACACICVV